MKKLNVGILCGGKSPEHEISLLSARGVIDTINKDKYNVIVMAIDKDGRWFAANDPSLLFEGDSAKTIKIKPANNSNRVMLLPHGKGRLVVLNEGDNNSLDHCSDNSGSDWRLLDVVFPVLHGCGGEDGTIQGLLELAEVPFVGAGVLGSAIGMDKDITKRLLRDAKIAVANFLAFKQHDIIDYDAVVEKLGQPLFVKPANAGSSVGVNKPKNKQQFEQAVKEAFQYDNKIIVEEFIEGREIECAVLGNDDPIASFPGEVIAHHEFYSYAAKYLDENGATLQVPANFAPQIIADIQHLAVEVFKVLECCGMARVDFFVRDDGKIYVNEINTIPGFTSISMYPKMWMAGGISYFALIEKLLQLALEKFQQKQCIKSGYL